MRGMRYRHTGAPLTVSRVELFGRQKPQPQQQTEVGARGRFQTIGIDARSDALPKARSSCVRLSIRRGAEHVGARGLGLASVQADLVLLRNVMGQMSGADVKAVLKRVGSSGAKYAKSPGAE